MRYNVNISGSKVPNSFGFIVLMDAFKWLTVLSISISTWKGVDLPARMQNMVAGDIRRMAKMAGFKVEVRPATQMGGKEGRG